MSGYFENKTIVRNHTVEHVKKGREKNKVRLCYQPGYYGATRNPASRRMNVKTVIRMGQPCITDDGR
jgi:hypothetical protein